MSKTNNLETDMLKLIFNGTTIANIADDATSGPATNLYVSLHTADPTDAATQADSECAYTSYDRVTVPRTTGGWAVSGDTCDNVAAITFPEATGGSETVTHFAIGLSAHPTDGVVLYTGTVTPNLAVSTGIQPEFAIGDCDITEG